MSQVALLLFRRSEARADEVKAGVSDAEVKRALGLGTAGYLAIAVFIAVVGGLMSDMSVGMLILFRHGASLGGLNVLVLRLHDRFGWSTGKVQLAFDAAIVLAGGAFTADLRRLGLSVLAVGTLNLVLVWNHRKGRYQPA